jgi:hypothetical protein
MQIKEGKKILFADLSRFCAFIANLSIGVHNLLISALLFIADLNIVVYSAYLRIAVNFLISALLCIDLSTVVNYYVLSSVLQLSLC